MFNVNIPRFDADNILHRDIAEAAVTAASVASEVSVEKAEYFTRTRKRIRAALGEEGIAARLEELAVELLDGE